MTLRHAIRPAFARHLSLALLCALALAAPPARAADTTSTESPRLLDVPLVGLPPSARGRAPAQIAVEARVDRWGRVLQARVAKPTGQRALDSSAVVAARWAVFRMPASTPATGTWVPFEVKPAATQAPPLRAIDDAITQAVTAERKGDHQNAMFLWMGALSRVGTHPEFANDWAIRERVVQEWHKVKPTPKVPVKYLQHWVRVEDMIERSLSTQSNLDVLERVKVILDAVPWHGPSWRVRAAAEAGADKPADALRSLQFWEIVSPDSTTRARAQAARERIVAGDLIVASRALHRP